jgi:hypothetical protein
MHLIRTKKEASNAYFGTIYPLVSLTGRGRCAPRLAEKLGEKIENQSPHKGQQ